MKVIDERGMLFGRINIIDFMGILFCVFLIPMFYFGYGIFKDNLNARVKNTPEAKKEFIEFKVDCLFIKLKPEEAKNISVGDKEYVGKDEVIGEIVEIGEITPYVHEFNIGAPGKITKEDLVLKQIPAKLRIKAEKRGNDLYYQDKQIKSNVVASFITDKYKAEFLPLFTKEINTIKTDISGVELVQILQSIDNKLNISNAKINNLSGLGAEINSLENKINNLERKINDLKQ